MVKITKLIEENKLTCEISFFPNYEYLPNAHVFRGTLYTLNFAVIPEFTVWQFGIPIWYCMNDWWGSLSKTYVKPCDKDIVMDQAMDQGLLSKPCNNLNCWAMRYIKCNLG